MPSELWQRLRAARTYRGKTQQQVGDAAGVSREAVSQWESEVPASRRNPGLTRLRMVESFLETPPGWLFNDQADLDPSMWSVSAEEASAPSLAPDLNAIEIPVFRRKIAGVSEPSVASYDLAGSLLFRPRSLERHGIKTQYAEIHYASDNAMAPRACAGDAVLVDGSDTKIEDGKLYLVEWGNRELLRLLFQELDGSIKVAASNTAPEYRDRTVRPGEPGFAVLGRVRWIGSWED